MDQTKPHRKHWFRISLASLLFATACVAGYLAGFRYGEKTQAANDRRLEKLYSQTYPVADLIRPLEASADWSAKQSDFDELIGLIRSTIASDTWATNQGGDGEIVPFASNGSLVVSNRGAVHDELAYLLQQLRMSQFQLPEESLYWAREVAARQTPTSQILKSMTKTTPEIHQRLNNHFDSVVDLLSDDFGSPDANLTAGDEGFPNWIGAQRLAVWNRQRGARYYLALRDTQPSGEALVVGWWEPSQGQIEPLADARP